jgi:hypothetical protein
VVDIKAAHTAPTSWFETGLRPSRVEYAR